MRSTLALNFFHDRVQYLTKSGQAFIRANIHKLSHSWAHIADLSAPPGCLSHSDIPCAVTESVRQTLP